MDEFLFDIVHRQFKGIRIKFMFTIYMKLFLRLIKN